MINELKQHINDIIAKNNDYKFDFSILDWKTDFLRFYQSQVNYNITKDRLTLNCAVHKGKKAMFFNISNPTISKIDEKLVEIFNFIDSLPDDEDFVDIEKDTSTSMQKVKVNNIELVTLEKKIEILDKFSEVAKKHSYKIFGTFICNYQTRYIINSNGLDKIDYSSPIMAEIKGVVDREKREEMVTVLEAFGAESFAKIDIESHIKSFENKLIAGEKEVIDIEPGEYEVILAPRCIGEFLQYLGSSFSASTIESKSNFFEGKENTQIFPDTVTIFDDPQNEDLMTSDYSNGGHKISKLMLIENGVFKNYLVDNSTSYKLNMPQNGNEGSCLVMKPGTEQLEDMISGVKKGLFISSLFYMNFINGKETSLTGLTRDGTFLIENGKITKVVNNLRFTEKISSIIENITQIENKNYVVPFSDNYGIFGIESMKMPHIRVSNFKISSSTHTI